MSGVVVVAGIFEPGSVATLVGVEDEAVMRPPEGDVVSRRLVDEDGNVGFDELEIGARYFVTGYVNGLFVMVRTIGVDASAPDTELQQPPVQAETPVIGTQQAPEVPVAPEPPADAPDLGVGVPEAAEAASPVVEPEAAADPPPVDPAPAPVPPADAPPAEPETKTAAGDSTVTVESNLPGVATETAADPPASEPAPATDVPADPAVSPDASAPAAEVPTPQDAGAPAEAPAAAGLPADEPPAEATADVPVDPSAPVQAAEPVDPAPAEVAAPAVDAAPAPDPAVADAPAPDAAPAPVTADEATALQEQAAGLGIETANLTVDQLREQITGRGATPAA